MHSRLLDQDSNTRRLRGIGLRIACIFTVVALHRNVIMRCWATEEKRDAKIQLTTEHLKYHVKCFSIFRAVGIQ
jgi:hypothetical protein